MINEFFIASNEQWTILLHVVFAMVLGSLIGLERESIKRPAGLRTHMLVTGAAALFVSFGNLLVRDYDFALQQEVLRADPIRIIEAVVTGVSFLGAGTIIRGEQGNVRGLTTAASLLFSAAIGVAVALNQFVLAVALTFLILIILGGLRLLEP